MKRLNNFAFILILFILFSATGCSQEYQSERYLYRATKLARGILISPEMILPREFDQALKAYKLVFERYPDTWSAKRARIALGSLYLAKKQNIKARAAFKKALELYPDDKKISMEARFATAKSYEQEGTWNKAALEYAGLIKDYPDTGMGLSLPIYVARHYELEKNIVERDRAYMKAISHYANISEKNPNTVLGFRAQNLIVMCYSKKEDWPQAVNSLEKLVMDYPKAKNVGLSLRMIADVCAIRLDTPERAIRIFEKFLAEHPQHPLKDYVKEGLEALSNVSTGE